MKRFPLPVPGEHDLPLPAWGPYSKKYFGVSHIADAERGVRFDCFLMPQLLRRKRELPDALAPCELYPDRAAADFSAWRCTWKLDDFVSAQLLFQLLPSNGAVISCTFINTGKNVVDAAIHLLGQLALETPLRMCAGNVLAALEPELPAGNGLNRDTRRPREYNESLAASGHMFQFFKGETVRFKLPGSLKGKKLFLRYQQNSVWHVQKLSAPEFFVECEQLFVDALFVTESEAPDFHTVAEDTVPEATFAGTRRLDFAFPGAGEKLCYSFCSEEDMTFSRRYAVDDLKNHFRYKDAVQQPYGREFVRQGSGADAALDWVRQVLHIPAHGKLTRRFTVHQGNGDDGMAVVPHAHCLHFNAPYALSAERLAAVMLTNIVYPIRVCGKAIRHFTPGKQWNSLYTWDSGFIGLGLLELSPRLAAAVLNTYLTREGDRDNAFILHGTPLPVQIFLLAELWNRTQNMALLRTLYPGARQFYRYLAGHLPGSTTRSHSRAALVSTWDYFYNSGGWDDYPPQSALHQAKLESRVLPVVPTAVLIRCAKLLRELGRIAGFPEDAEYAADIEAFSHALLQYSWDDPSGYFGYVVHDDAGTPEGIYRTEKGENFNRGLDGTSPLISGDFPPEVRRKLWAHLESETECFTPYGISCVDRCASYFREEGYWNGAVWMPHQWFLWKAALSDGRGEFAWRIAETALRTYENACRSSGYCFEHFSTASGWGGGWHHFSGLSTPVLIWQRAYFGRVQFSCGYNTFVLARRNCRNRIEITLRQQGEAGGHSAVLLSARVKRAEYNGLDLTITRRGNASEVEIPDNSQGVLVWYV